MNEFFKDAKEDKVILAGFSTSFILVIITVVYILFYYSSLPPFIPLFNQLPWGNIRLGTTIMIFIPIALAFFISIINMVISSIIYKKMQVLSRILATTSLLIAFLSFLFILRTISLII